MKNISENRERYNQIKDKMFSRFDEEKKYLTVYSFTNDESRLTLYNGILKFFQNNIINDDYSGIRFDDYMLDLEFKDKNKYRAICSDKNTILKLLKITSKVLNYVDPSYLEDPEFMLNAVRSNFLSLKYVSSDLNNYGEIVKDALKQNICSYLLLSSDESFNYYRNVVYNVVDNYNSKLKFGTGSKAM